MPVSPSSDPRGSYWTGSLRRLAYTVASFGSTMLFGVGYPAIVRLNKARSTIVAEYTGVRRLLRLPTAEWLSLLVSQLPERTWVVVPVRELSAHHSNYEVLCTMAVIEPAIAKQDYMEKIVGRPLPTAIFKFRPWGHRIVIVREASPDTTQGGIIIPDQMKEPPAAGWVVSAGALVGQPSVGMDGRYGGWWGDPWDLLGRRVVFGLYSGQALHLGTIRRESAYDSNYIMIDDYDIWGDVLDGE